MNEHVRLLNPSFTTTSTAQQGTMLQRNCACGTHSAGGGCPACSKKKLHLQRKLSIGAIDDPHEFEADRVAEQVMAMPTHAGVSSVTTHIQRYPGQLHGQMDTAPSSVEHVLASSGRALEPMLRRDMEQRFGYDFSHVRIHTGQAAEQSARDVNAIAFTMGSNIAFAAGQFSPTTRGGRTLLAHELTHVVQQTGVRAVNVADRLSSSAVAGPLVQRAPAGAVFSLNIDEFEGKVRRAIAYLANVGSTAEETTFVFYSVPILSQLAAGGFGYIDRNRRPYHGLILDFSFPAGRFSLSLVLDDTPPPENREVERGYFRPDGNTGTIGLRLQSELARQSVEEIASVLYHETIHLYSHLLRSGLWFSSTRTGRTLQPAVRAGVSLRSYRNQTRRVERQINSFIPLINRARQSRGAANVTAAQVSEFAQGLVEEAMVRAETFYFSAVRSTGPGTRGMEHEMTITGGGSYLNSYLFQMGDMLTPDDATAISRDSTAQSALRVIQAILDGVYSDHFRERWGPVNQTQELPTTRPSTARGFQP